MPRLGFSLATFRFPGIGFFDLGWAILDFKPGLRNGGFSVYTQEF